MGICSRRFSPEATKTEGKCHRNRERLPYLMEGGAAVEDGREMATLVAGSAAADSESAMERSQRRCAYELIRRGDDAILIFFPLLDSVLDDKKMRVFDSVFDETSIGG
jgi:hypothetical protein